MSIYLPIAEIPVNIFLLMFIGMAGGIMAGLFGIGGGFLITPILIFIGIPPSVAVATSSNQIIASSVTGFISHWYRKAVDIKMGCYLLIGGLIGSYIGVQIFSLLKAYGQIDLSISIIYVLFLGSIGGMMLIESSKLLFNIKSAPQVEEESKKDKYNDVWAFSNLIGLLTWIKTSLRKIELPWVINFPKSELRMSALMPISVGLFAGILVSLMGIGGGFVLIPAMLYLLKMPSNVVVGTSLFQIIFTTSVVTILHAANTQTVDIVLALILIAGGVFGAQLGSRIGPKIKAEKLRFLLAILVLALCFRLAIGLFFEPKEIYTIEKSAD